jgi:hypothetical protein
MTEQAGSVQKQRDKGPEPTTSKVFIEDSHSKKQIQSKFKLLRLKQSYH